MGLGKWLIGKLKGAYRWGKNLIGKISGGAKLVQDVAGKISHIPIIGDAAKMAYKNMVPETARDMIKEGLDIAAGAQDKFLEKEAEAKERLKGVMEGIKDVRGTIKSGIQPRNNVKPPILV